MNATPPQQSPPDAKHDSDGLPPGLDTVLTGTTKIIRFTGHFYALPQYKSLEIKRLVKILFASPEAYVAYDLATRNIYNVLRHNGLSLGCRMTAELLDHDGGPFKETMAVLEQ